MKLKSLNTRRGDSGETDLFYGGRIKKNDWPVKIGGQISLFNATIGLCHQHLDTDNTDDCALLAILSQVQGDLISVMGEIYTSEENLEKYYAIKSPMTESNISILDELIENLGEDLDDAGYKVMGWITYGSEGAAAAAFDYCAELCRTIEPIIYDAADAGFNIRQEVRVYFNRLSKLFYLMARTKAEQDGRI